MRRSSHKRGRGGAAQSWPPAPARHVLTLPRQMVYDRAPQQGSSATRHSPAAGCGGGSKGQGGPVSQTVRVCSELQNSHTTTTTSNRQRQEAQHTARATSP